MSTKSSLWLLSLFLFFAPLNVFAAPVVSSPDPSDGATVAPSVTGQLLKVAVQDTDGGIIFYGINPASVTNEVYVTASGGFLEATIPYTSGEMTDDGINYWYVEAAKLINPIGPVFETIRYPSTGYLSFTVTPTPPPPPTVSNPDPADSATVTAGSTGQLLRVYAPGSTSGTIHYDVNDTVSLGYQATATVNGDFLEAIIPYVGGQMNDNGTNYWYVEATNAGGTTRYPATSGNLSFTVTPPPPVVSNPDPADGATVAAGPTGQLLQVYAPGSTSGTIHYDVNDNPSLGFQTAATINGDFLEAIIPYAGGQMDDNGTNYWYVEATNTAGTTRYPPASGNLSFTATTLPPVVSNPDPADGATVKAGDAGQLLRVYAPGATSGNIYYDDNDAVTLNNQTAATVNGDYLEAVIPYTPGQMEKNGTNYWYVEATNANGTTMYPASGNLSFEVTYKFPWLMFIQNFKSSPSTSTGPKPTGVVSIKVYPEHVGVFTSIGQQQFVVFGTKQNGDQVNITDWANCSSSNTSKVAVNSTGLATIISGVTAGQVKITCNFDYLPSNSTSLTIVNLTQRYHGNRATSVDVTQWSGAWPSIADTAFDPSGQEVYLYDAQVIGHGQTWVTRPWTYPYPPFPNGLNAMIANVYSTDGGQTFALYSWDYLAPTGHSKGGEGTWPNCWIGTMVHSFCDFAPGDCNGRNRTNLYFSAYNGDSSCWGAQVMN